VITLRSLYWPGFTAYHQLGRGYKSYGSLYVGTGKKNWDVPFMVLPLPADRRPSVVEGGPAFRYEEDESNSGKNDEIPGEIDDDQPEKRENDDGGDFKEEGFDEPSDNESNYGEQ